MLKNRVWVDHVIKEVAFGIERFGRGKGFGFRIEISRSDE
jgi:hypothetical protein